MFCNQCGNEIPDGSKFCHICGAKMIVPQEIVQEVQPIQPSYEQEIQRNYAQSDYSQTNYTQTDYTQIYDGYNGQQYTDNTQPAYVSNTVIPTATEKKVNKPASGKKKGLIIGGSIAATLIAAVAIVLIVLAPFKKKDKETSQLPFGKITYGMTRNEGIERYGEPYYTYDHGDYLYDCYGYEFMGVKGTFLISYLDNEFTDSWWESIDITSYVDENQRYDYDYNTYNELKSKQTDIEKLFDEFIGESGKIDFSEGGYIGKIWRNQSDEQAVRNEIKAYVSTIELYTDSGDGEFSISFYYADYNALAREDSNDQYYTTEAVIEETAEATTEATTEAATEEEINNSVIYIYGSNNDLENVLQGFYNKYPEYRDRVVYKSLDVAYYDLEEYLNPEFNSSEVPSIVIYDNECIDNLFDTERYCSMDEIGFDDNMLADMYPYTRDIATYNGRLMGLSPYVCPGGFIYRTDIAEQIFGTSDPNVIGGYFSTWDGVLEAASMLKANGYYLVPETTCVARCMGDNYNQSVIDTMINNGYSKQLEEWTTDWLNCFREDVFGMFGCDWIFYTYGGLGYDTALSTEVCTVPNAYYWGGYTVGVTRACPDKELAKLVLYSICCDYDAMYYNANNIGNMPNNRSVVNSFIQEGKMPYDWYNIDSVSIQPHILSVFDEVGARVGQ